MKPFYLIKLFFLFPVFIWGQDAAVYEAAMEAYSEQNYALSAIKFEEFFAEDWKNLSADMQYNGACVFALVNQPEKAFELLENIVERYQLSNIDRFLSDSDLNSLHQAERWTFMLDKMKENKRTLPERRRKNITKELQKVRTLLQVEGGKMWKEGLWNERTLVLDEENIAYSLKAFEGSITQDSVLFYATLAPATLQQTNTTQLFQGEKWVTVRNDYLSDDESETLIHELFHLAHLKDQNLAANVLAYLDEKDARVWMRLEFEALRNALKNITNITSLNLFLADALYFRKQRQDQYPTELQETLSLENVEGLANYTGVALSTHPHKIQKAIKELNEREAAETFSRAFPYATGVAYGLLFDELKMDWRKGFKHLYDFLCIYETEKGIIQQNEFRLKEAQERNQFTKIFTEETERAVKNELLKKYYTQLFESEGILKVSIDITDPSLLISFDMNATFALPNKNIVYSQIQGESSSLKHFGSFSILPEQAALGKTGILITPNFTEITFPKVLVIENNLIKGEYYEIRLNQGWKIIPEDKNYRLVKME